MSLIDTTIYLLDWLSNQNINNDLVPAYATILNCYLVAGGFRLMANVTATNISLVEYFNSYISYEINQGIVHIWNKNMSKYQGKDIYDQGVNYGYVSPQYGLRTPGYQLSFDIYRKGQKITNILKQIVVYDVTEKTIDDYRHKLNYYLHQLNCSAEAIYC